MVLYHFLNLAIGALVFVLSLIMFNSVKANTKWVEYSCCNIAGATNLDPYCYGSPKNSLILCDSPVAWKDAFSINQLRGWLMQSNSQDYVTLVF